MDKFFKRNFIQITNSTFKKYLLIKQQRIATFRSTDFIKGVKGNLIKTCLSELGALYVDVSAFSLLNNRVKVQNLIYR